MRYLARRASKKQAAEVDRYFHLRVVNATSYDAVDPSADCRARASSNVSIEPMVVDLVPVLRARTILVVDFLHIGRDYKLFHSTNHALRTFKSKQR